MDIFNWSFETNEKNIARGPSRFVLQPTTKQQQQLLQQQATVNDRQNLNIMFASVRFSNYVTTYMLYITAT